MHTSAMASTTITANHCRNRHAVNARRFSFSCLSVPFRWPYNSAASRIAGRAARTTGPARFESEIAAFEKWDHQNAVPQRPASSSSAAPRSASGKRPTPSPTCPSSTAASAAPRSPTSTTSPTASSSNTNRALIVFYAGDNDIAAGRSPDRVFSDFQTFANIRPRAPARTRRSSTSRSNPASPAGNSGRKCKPSTPA